MVALSVAIPFDIILIAITGPFFPRCGNTRIRELLCWVAATLCAELKELSALSCSPLS